MSDNRKDLPQPGAPNFQDRVRETLSTYLGTRGNKLDRGVTLRDLAAVGIIKLRESYLNSGGGAPIAGPGPTVGGVYEPELTPPPTPEGFAASAAFSNIFLECSAPTYTQGHGHARSVVYGASWISGPLPTFASAVRITEFPGTVHAHPSNPAITWHLWLKWLSVDGVESAAPAGGTNGQVVTTGLDATSVIAALTGPGNPFKIVSEPMTLPDGSEVPVGTYTSDAYIHNGFIINAMIANLAVDNAKIANLSVSKLTAGSLAVGQFAQSTSYEPGSAGWRINGDGTAEFSGVIVRGTVYATAGHVGGLVIADDSISSPNYDGTNGFRLGADGTMVLPAGSVTADRINVNTLAAITARLGYVTAGQVNIVSDGAGSWGYIQSNSKWLDGNWGWVLAQHPDGSMFVDLVSAGCGLRMYHNAGVSVEFRLYGPGFNLDQNGLTISQANVINTLNLAGNAVTVPSSATAWTEVGYNQYTPVLTCPTIDPQGGSVLIIASVLDFPASTFEGGDPLPNRYQIRRNGTVILPAIGTQNLGGQFVTFVITDSYNGAASYDLTLLSGLGGGGLGTVSTRTLSVLGVKR